MVEKLSNVFVILGNGFSMDFLQYYSKTDTSIQDKIDVCNLFRFGDIIKMPWSQSPGFLSYRNTPELWKLGARTNCSTLESNALIEEIITCANMFFDFVNEENDPKTRVKMKEEGSLYLKAYCELIAYLRQLFIYYDGLISDEALNRFIEKSDWGWIQFFKEIKRKKFDQVTFVTYNYDIWLEKILRTLNISFHICGLEKNEFNSTNSLVNIIKPHGSISFIPKQMSIPSYSINYSLDIEDASLDAFNVQYENLNEVNEYVNRGAMIPPSGDSTRLRADTWAKTLRTQAEEKAAQISEGENVILCGLSYGYVDRKEIDGILLSLNPNCNFTFINPNPPRDLNAVLMTIFKYYVLLSSSKNVAGVLNGKIV